MTVPLDACPTRRPTVRSLGLLRAGMLVLLALALLLPAGGGRAGRFSGAAQSCASKGAFSCVPTTVQLRKGKGAAGKHSHLDLVQGHALVLETPFTVNRVAVGDPEVADVVVVDTRQVNIVPLKVGETNLIIWNKAGDVEAAIDLNVGRRHSRLERELRRILDNESLVVEGSLNSLVLKGTVEGPIQMQHTLDVASALAGVPSKPQGSGGAGQNAPQIINLLKVGGNQQVMIEVIVAEMDRRLTRRLGTNLAGVYGSGGTDVNLFSLLQGLSRLENSAAPQVLDLSSRVNFISTISRGSDSLDIFIEAIQSDGLIKILAEPNLVARSGGSAEFLVGGEVPIPIPQSGSFGTITVEFKPFGVGVQFTPTVLTSNRIYLDVSTEVSEPNPTLGLESGGMKIPGFNTRRAATALELGDGESFAIAGLLRDDVNESISELPGLGDLPIFGALFRSTEFERKQTELVIIVTPRLVRPGPMGRPPLPTDHFVVPTAVEFFLHGSMEARSKHAAAVPEAGQESAEAAPSQDRSSTSPQDESSTSPQDEGSSSPQDESSTSPQDEGSASPQDEGTPLTEPVTTKPRAEIPGLTDTFAGQIGHSLDLESAEGELQ